MSTSYDTIDGTSSAEFYGGALTRSLQNLRSQSHQWQHVQWAVSQLRFCGMPCICSEIRRRRLPALTFLRSVKRSAQAEQLPRRRPFDASAQVSAEAPKTVAAGAYGKPDTWVAYAKNFSDFIHGHYVDRNRHPAFDTRAPLLTGSLLSAAFYDQMVVLVSITAFGC